MNSFPEICNPKRIRKAKRTLRIRKQLIAFNLLIIMVLAYLIFVPTPPSRGYVHLPLPIEPPFKEDPSLSFPEPQFFSILRETNQSLKDFLESQKITQDDLLSLKIRDPSEKTAHINFHHEEISQPLYKASFFLESFGSRKNIWKELQSRFQQRTSNWPLQGTPPTTPIFRLDRPTSNHIIFTVEIMDQLTHELVFYFPSKTRTMFPFIKRGKPKIAVILDDLGESWEGMDDIFSMDPAITLSILPNSAFGLRLAKKAMMRGNQIFLHLPMEPQDAEKMNTDDFLTTKMNRNKMDNILNLHLDFLPRFSGVNNHMGSRFTQDSQGMDLVLRKLKSRNLFFLDSRTTDSTVGYRMAKGLKMPTAIRDVFLDHEPNPKHIDQQFQILRTIAKKKGYGIAIGHPHSETIEALKKQIPLLKQEGFELVPVTKI